MANIPPLTLPPVGVDADARADLIIKINIEREKRGEPEIPAPTTDFANPEEPLRIEVEALLGRVANTVPGTTKQTRNKDRYTLVKNYLEKNYPTNRRLQTKVLADLESYQMWENDRA